MSDQSPKYTDGAVKAATGKTTKAEPKATDPKPPVDRSAAARKAMASRTPEQRSESARKAIATMRKPGGKLYRPPAKTEPKPKAPAKAKPITAPTKRKPAAKKAATTKEVVA